MMMKCYLEIEVPVRYETLWFRELRDACMGVDVRWQRAWHHITMAFLDEVPTGVDFRGILDRHLKHYQAPRIDVRQSGLIPYQIRYAHHLSFGHTCT